MTTYVATQDGNWSDTATWGASGPPGDGDSAHIPSGIDVTVGANTTVGLAAAMSAPQASADNMSVAAAAGGSLPNGAYRLFYTNVIGGAESGPSGEATVTLSGGNNTINVTLPALGSNDSRNIYLSEAGGGSLTGRLYQAGVTSTTPSLSSASWTDGTTTYANAARVPVAIMVHGTLTIDVGFSLTVKGDVVLVNAPITGGAGSSFIGNVPASTVYRVIVGTDSGQTSAKITLTGTSGSKCTVDRSGTGTWQWTAAGRAHSGGTQANGHGGYALTHCNVTDLGSASVNAIEFCSFGGGELKLDNTIIDGCGQIHLPNTPDTTTKLNFNHLTIRNALGTNGLSYEVSGTTPTGAGVRNMTSCVFDCPVRFSMNGFTVGNDDTDGNWFFGTRNHQGGAAASFKGNFVQFKSGANELLLTGTIAPTDNVYFCYNGNSTDIDNIHWIVSTNGSTLSPDGDIFEAPFTGGDGDCYYANERWSCHAQRVVLLPALDGAGEPGCLINMSSNGGDTNTFSAEHCTMAVSEEGALTTESAQRASMVTSYKSNLAIAVSGAQSDYHVGHFGTMTQDSIPANVCTNNAGFGLAAGSEGGGYNYDMSGTPGTDDLVNADPGFTWPNVVDWAESLGETGTDVQKIDAVLAALKRRNDSDYDSDYSVAAYRAFILAAIIPTNEDYRDAGHDAVTIGAVEMAAGGQTIAIGQSLETDSAFALAAKKTRALGQPSESDTAQPVTTRKTRALGLVTDSDLALPVTVKKTIPLGLALETDTAQAITVAGGVELAPTFPGSVVARRQGLTCQPKRAGLGSVTIERRTT